ncbi:MAG: BLUF domain-containing protein [Brevundimonas sp.]|uniref:BLUF domain-containing protein n=1 Tax=Brevundimonas sp. TaxID=1871086 RepID=UPI00248A1F40|nr:BLUF domain-containing protein [Brevundimonas sp.]MDI1327989.1 BLUF domain-containing protein [Brevundimonas sp.]
MLHRVIYSSEAVGATGVSTLSVAQILGHAERNNRRDHITSCVMFHQGHILQVIEGARTDIDRLMRRLLVDPRHSGHRILVDTPVAARMLAEPMGLCSDPATLLGRLGLSCLSSITANEAQAILEYRTAA